MTIFFAMFRLKVGYCGYGDRNPLKIGGGRVFKRQLMLKGLCLNLVNGDSVQYFKLIND